MGEGIAAHSPARNFKSGLQGQAALLQPTATCNRGEALNLAFPELLLLMADL
ncbi:hypothetical protein GCM10008938_28250 [Deinococcus roseus]|uniref:Transposase n=1 Tax=Deinococcus roseus TaxID=392414 RepID=A0ABQ2D252_9DEIO|nr:hypothetical protein GCM10008938_28250 [Deinococcus roseus]